MKIPSVSHINVIVLLMLLLALIMLLPACTPSQTGNTTSQTTTTPVISSTRDPFAPPTVVELAEKHYSSPELPRITCEQVKNMISEAQTNKRYVGMGGMTTWTDFIIIDVRSSKGEVLGAPGFNLPGHILGARSMPMTWYWVTDPREDPKVEEAEAYKQELTALEENIHQLPKGLPIYIYDGTADDEAACIVAEMVLEAGFDTSSVKVIWQGFSRWYYDLQYPIVQGDYQFEGE
jgi:hypothetical protein